MLKALKTFGIGLVYILIFPLIIVASLGYAAFGIIYGIGYTFVLVSRFFRGKKLFPPFEEDIYAEENINQSYDAQLGEEKPAKPASNVYVQQNYYQAPQKQQGQENAFPQFPQMDQNNPYGNIDARYQKMTGRISPQPQQELPKICSYDEEGNPLDEDGLPILIRKERNENE